MKPAAFALFALTVGGGPALAETEAERTACTPDVWRLCASQIPSVGAITACLHRQKSSLSAACRTVMEDSASPVRTVATRR